MELKLAFQNIVNACSTIRFDMTQGQQAEILKQSIEAVGKTLFPEAQEEKKAE